jgi:hypothetical protein
MGEPIAINNPPPDDWSKFLMEDYKLKVGYLTAQFSRMWTRFQYFIVLEGVLSTAFFGFFRNNENRANGVWVAVTGAVVALCWYFFGAQDKYLVETYRSQIRYVLRELFARNKFSVPLCFDEVTSAQHAAVRGAVANPCYPDTGGTRHSGDVRKNLLCWRSDLLSITNLAAGFPVIVFAFWAFWAIALLLS